MTVKNKEAQSEDSNQNGVSEEEVRKESSKVAKQATEAQNKATELMQAAAAAGDPEERQKLMEQALEQQIQSKSLGKTAKYLRSGTFQGMAVGAGLGIAPGASLGAITGTLVGGVSSTALGGLGAGIGAATGALHGPFWDMKKGAGKGIQKITNSLPGWKATESQKKQLEKMVGQINEQDTPGKDELESWGNESVSEDQTEALESVKSKMPSTPFTGNSDKSGKQESSTEKKTEEETGEEEEEEEQKIEPSKPEDSAGDQAKEEVRRNESKTDQQDNNSIHRIPNESEILKKSDDAQEKPQETQSTYKGAAAQTEDEGRKKPRKLQPRSNNGNASSNQPAATRKQPRKLEKRST